MLLSELEYKYIKRGTVMSNDGKMIPPPPPPPPPPVNSVNLNTKGAKALLGEIAKGKTLKAVDQNSRRSGAKITDGADGSRLSNAIKYSGTVSNTGAEEDEWGQEQPSDTKQPKTPSTQLANAVTKGLGAETPEERAIREDREDAESKARVAAANEAKKVRDAASVAAATAKAAQKAAEPKVTAAPKDMKEERIKHNLKAFEDYQQNIKIASRMSDPDEREEATLAYTAKYKKEAKLSPAQEAAFDIYLEESSEVTKTAFIESLNVIEKAAATGNGFGDKGAFAEQQAALNAMFDKKKRETVAPKPVATAAAAAAQAPRLTRQEVQAQRQSIGSLYNAANAKLQQEIPLAPLRGDDTLDAHIAHVEQALGLKPSGAKIVNDELLQKLNDVVVVPGTKQEVVRPLAPPPPPPPTPNFGAGQSTIPSHTTTQETKKLPFLAQIESRRATESATAPAQAKTVVDPQVSRRENPFSGLPTDLSDLPVVAIFDNDSAIGRYLSSKPPRELAISLYQNMSQNNIEIPKVIIMDDEMKKSFSPGVLSQMQKVGQELERHRESRGSWVAGTIRRMGDGVATVWNALTSLFGKTVDDPQLKAACDEYNQKGHAIVAKGDNAKKASTFAEQILVSKGGTIPRNMQ